MELLLMSVAIIFAFISGVIAQASSSVSITAEPGYAVQRQCVKCNLWECYGDVNDFLQCDGLNYCYCRTDLSSAVNSLLSSRLSTDCTPGPATNDISAAISIYSQYCAQALGSVATTSQTLPSSTSAGSAQPASSPPPTGTAVVSNTGSPVTSTTVQVETATASSNAESSLSVPLITLATSAAPPSEVIVTQHSTTTLDAAEQSAGGGSNGGGGRSLNGGEIAGIVIGIISALGTIAGVYLAWRLLKNGKGSDNSRRDGWSGQRDLRGARENRDSGQLIEL